MNDFDLQKIRDLLDRSLIGNSADRWLTALGVALGTFLVLRILQSLVRRRLEKWSERASGDTARLSVKMVGGTRWWFLLAASLFAATQVLKLPADVQNFFNSAFIAILLLQAALWGNYLLDAVIARYVERRPDYDPAAAMTVSAVGVLARIGLWSLAVILVLANFGVDVTALIAGLGIGGIAVALAAQNILGDLFASLSIVLDKPFVVGDFIIVGDFMGSVERVGVKTTRVRSLSGEQLVFANNDLLQSRIRNYKRMQERRIVFSLGVTYDTPHEKLASLPGMIQQVVADQEQTRFDRAHFQSYGDSALVFEVVYYVLVPDYNVYMDIQQAINLEIYRRCEQQDISFAFPSRTVYLRHDEQLIAGPPSPGGPPSPATT